MTSEQEQARIRGLVSAARAVLTLQQGLIPGCARIHNKARWLGQDFLREFESAFPIFGEVWTRTRGLPVSSERLHWETESLLREDKKVAAIESEVREEVMRSCSVIIERYG